MAAHFTIRYKIQQSCYRRLRWCLHMPDTIITVCEVQMLSVDVVTPTAFRFDDIVDVENEIGYDLDHALFTPYAGKAVIIANAIVPDVD